LSLLNATLTLPGIAGIVLTVGIAVDSNVLIYERIREELRGGRNAISAIDAGFRRAVDDPGFQHHYLYRRRGAVLYRHRAGARFCRNARHRHHHHGFHRVYADPPDRCVVGALEAAADGADLGNAALTHFVLIALGVLIAVLIV